jgi:hypothetical protein
MYNLNKILNRLFKKKQIHADSTSITKSATISLTQNATTTSASTRSKFRFMKKISKKCARDPKGNNLSSSFKSSTTTILTTLTTASPQHDQSVGKSLDQLSNRSSSNKLNQVVAEQVVYNQETSNHQQQVNSDFAFLNNHFMQISKISLANSSMSSDKYTIEQMYNDNNVQTNIYLDLLDKNVYSTGSLNDSSSSDDSEASEMDDRRRDVVNNHLNVQRFGSNQTLKSMLNADLSDEIFKNSISLYKLEELIRIKIAALKLIASKLCIQIPKHLTMLETIYELKMDQVRKEAKDDLKRFEYQNDQTTSFREKLKIRTNKFFRFNTNNRNRSKSVECSQMETSCTSNKSNRSDRSDKSDQEFKHKNYYSLERDTIERKYENKMRLIQFDILNSINSIELQFEELKRMKELELENQHLTPLSNYHHHHRHRHHQLGRCHHHQRRCTSRNLETIKQPAINYSTEHAMQKRIRRKIKNRTLEMSKSNQTLNLLSQTLNGNDSNERRMSRFRLAFDSNEYKNPNAFETMV